MSMIANYSPLLHLLSSVFVYLDAKEINAGVAQPRLGQSRIVSWTPIIWAILVYIIPIILFAFYIYKRREIYRVNMPVADI
jgi:hypothetical protein